jgi:hypothetical protein
VPNFDFAEIYLPGSDTITGVISGFDWTSGVGPDCSIDRDCLPLGGYNFSDGTFGAVADNVDIADAIRVLGYLFASGDMLAPDGALIKSPANPASCKPYSPAEVALPCAQQCTAK